MSFDGKMNHTNWLIIFFGGSELRSSEWFDVKIGKGRNRNYSKLTIISKYEGYLYLCAQVKFNCMTITAINFMNYEFIKYIKNKVKSSKSQFGNVAVNIIMTLKILPFMSLQNYCC